MFLIRNRLFILLLKEERRWNSRVQNSITKVLDLTLELDLCRVISGFDFRLVKEEGEEVTTHEHKNLSQRYSKYRVLQNIVRFLKCTAIFSLFSCQWPLL